MRAHALVVLAFAALSARAGWLNAAEGNKVDKLQGTWTCVLGERNGKPIADATVKKLKLVLTRDKYTTSRGDVVLFDGEYKLDTTKDPLEIDILATEGESKGKTSKGIYKLDGDTLKLCYSEPGKDRPKAFESKPETDVTLTVWKRAKP